MYLQKTNFDKHSCRMNDKINSFNRLLGIMDELREKCPWDKKQSFESLSSLTIEETYELIDAIEAKDLSSIKEELGDLLLHIVFYSKIASETSAFNIHEVIDQICEKLIKRHPHIYGDLKVESEVEVKQNWEKIKLQDGKKKLLEGVPNALPALIKAQRMQEKAAQVGFEWTDKAQVWGKVEEEIAEFFEASRSGTQEEKTEEFGDVLFSLINFARFEGVDANRALDLTNRKFKERIEYIERNGTKALTEMTLEEMDALWEKAKLIKA